MCAAFIGNPTCGHQAAVSIIGDDWWSFYDPDVVSLDVGPIFIKTKDPYREFKYVSSIAKRSSITRHCDMNVLNRTEEHFSKATKSLQSVDDIVENDVIHMDWLYVAKLN
jgi:hypothetical protein